MKIGVLGTGAVGQRLASKLIELGHQVTMGSRSADGEALLEWVRQSGENALGGAFAEAASDGELVFNCTAGTASLEALEAAGAENLAGKVLVDVSNPLDFSGGMPPTLTVCNDDSLGEQIQAAFPEARVVKTLNTVNNVVMTDPGRLPGRHNVFVCGNEERAKAEVTELLESFGWPPEAVIDLGDISAARGMEMYLPLWVRLMGTLGTAEFNVQVRVP
ncbi:MAG TPA: NAD(P)-binding domain-containing protein [Solirubrobacterales bacterium]